MGEYTWDLDSGGTSGEVKAEFTKFPVGTTRIRILESAPYVRWTHWLPQFNRSINCPGFSVCPIDDIITKAKANKEKTKYNRSRRFAINVFNYETNRIEIMEQGKGFFEDLRLIMEDLKEENKGLSDVILRVRRTGTGKDDTKYRIDVDSNTSDPIPEGELINLKEYFKPHTPEQITRLLNGEPWDDVMKSDSSDESDPKDEAIEVE